MNNMHTARLQAWLNEIIVRQGDMQHKLGVANHIYQTSETEIITESRDVSIYSRLHVYTSGYVMRLLECLAADYQVLEKFLGKEVFDRFARAALLWSPSTSYSLYDLGEVFIRFLEATRPRPMSEDEAPNILLELPIEIAKVERSRQIALRSIGLEHKQEYSDWFPEDILFNPYSIRIKAPDTLKLLQVKFAFKEFFDAFAQQKELSIPEARESFLAISRMNYRLHMEELSEWQYHFLNTADTEITLMDAVQLTAKRCKISSSTLLADLFVWLPVFANKGYLEVL
jgi:hypothetical protein